ncbi:MAG: DNA methyltransferase, partial [Synechococcaceae cyanobacterium]|nr:DNA methyltransferase [Synechococcaceae cyanobacterium]
LTEPIVAEAFRPWLEGCNHKPTAEQILALKVCDPAMGSGAFLVAVCRFLAGWLVEAWERDGYPDDFRQEWDKDIVARRRIAQSCLYGVDKNPFAVNLAKLSLWLVTLSKELPFTFVDHAFKCGDSLVGYSVKEIRAAMSEVQLGFLDAQNRIYEQMGIDRRESFAFDSLSDADYDSKKLRLDEQIKATEGLRQAGDLIVAAFFAKTKAKERADKQQVYLAMLSGAFEDEGLQDSIQEIRDRLAAGEKGIRPFHWDLEFPEVFGEGRGGFDVFVGNPPFAGKNTIAEGSPDGILDWFKQLHPESHGNADLVAHFFRRCFDLLRPSGSLGLIATNTIAQGDTRSTGLRWICLNGGTIYAAHKRYKWPGVAAVVVSVVHLLKGAYAGEKKLDKRPVPQITAFLFANGGHDDPSQLAINAGKSFQGSIVLGMGFTFDDSGPADDDTPGMPSPIATMERLIAENPKYAEVIFPYIGGEEVNESPTHAHHRYLIDFRDRSETECRAHWPELMGLLEKKVKPIRQERRSNGEFKQRSPLPQKWWIHAEKRPALYAAISPCNRVLATNAQASVHHCVSFMLAGSVFANSLNIFPLDKWEHLCIMQSSIHEAFARFLSSSLGDGLRYNPSDCFSTFPFPTALLKPAANDPSHEATRHSLEAIGKRYHQLRAELMLSNNEGLTSTYNRFHDPSETSSGLIELRSLHCEMDQAVLAAYGWKDVPELGPGNSPCGFGLDYLDTEEDAQLPDELQERIDSGELFFWDANEALDFQGQLQAYGAITGRRKLPWRYRWPDAVRDDVLARLLALNAERYQEEVALGLHSKAGKQAAKAARAGTPATGKRRGRAPKAGQGGETGGDLSAQMGLGL